MITFFSIITDAPQRLRWPKGMPKIHSVQSFGLPFFTFWPSETLRSIVDDGEKGK